MPDLQTHSYASDFFESLEGVMIVVAVKHLNFKKEVIGEWLKYYFNQH